MFKGKKENYPFSVCRPFVDTRVGKKISFSLLCATEIYINTHCVFFLIYEEVEDINIKVLQMIQREHIKVNCIYNYFKYHISRSIFIFCLNTFRYLHSVS